MATASDITNSMGVEEKSTPHAPQADDLIDEISREDVLESSNLDDITPYDFSEHHKDTSSLPKHLFDSAKERVDTYQEVQKIFAKDPRLYPRSGMTKETFFKPHFYYETEVAGFSSSEPMPGSAVAIPPRVSLSENHPQAWECGCLHYL
jgi:hypothetical protein